MKIAVGISLLFLSAHVCAQQQLTPVVKEPVSCTVNYQAAQDAFDTGKFDQVVSLLTSCPQNKLSEQEKIDVLLLLCKTYYYERDVSSAEKQARKIFRLDPEYQLDPNEKIGVQTIFEKVKPKVQQSVSFLLGINFALPKTITGSNYEGNPLIITSTDQKTQPGFDANLQWKYYTNPGVDPIVGISYSQTRFIRTSVNRSEVFNSILTEAEETDHLLKFELGASYSLKKRFLGFKPMFELGGAYNYILSSNVSVSTDYLKRDKVPLNTPGLNFSDNRKNSFGIFLSVGGLKKVHSGNLMFKLQYYKGITTQVNTHQLLRHQELIFNSYYFDNDFKLNYITLAIGFERFYFKY